jgi:hypothetical protein
MVSVSWFCPECGGSCNDATFKNLCVCGHVYEHHHTTQDVKPSRGAFGMSLDEMDKLDEVLATKPEPMPKIGYCTACTCPRFKLDPPLLPAKVFLHEVDIAAQRGFRGRETKVTKEADETRCFIKGERSVRLCIQSEDSLLMEALDVDKPKPKIIRMGRDTIGKTVIAIHTILRAP